MYFIGLLFIFAVKIAEGRTPIKNIHISAICYGLVDSYCYLDRSDSIQESDIIEEMLPYGIEYFPQECQLNIRRSICGNVYRKCTNGIVANASYSASEASPQWNGDMYSNVSSTGLPYPLPFERPCLNICTNISCSCRGIPELFGYTTCCSTATFDYSDGQVSSADAKEPLYYDSSNNASVCNAVTNNSALDLVGVTSEPYLHKDNPAGACYGIVDYDIYIPAGDFIFANSSKMQYPFAVQQQLEDMLLRLFDNIPKWLDEDCYLAAMKYICGVTLMPSVAVSISNSTIFVPSYPSKELCQNYNNTCYNFFSRADLNAFSSFLYPDCDAVDSNGINNFPESDQIVLQIKDGVNGTVVMNVSSSPNVFSEVDDSILSDYQAECPVGFVVPNNPDDPEVRWIPGSGCAVPCVSNIYTSDEWRFFTMFERTLLLIGIPSLCFIIFTVFHDEKRRYGFFLMNLIYIISASNGVVSLISNFMTYEDQFCRDNATIITLDDGYGMCMAQSSIYFYAIYSCLTAWLMQCILLYVKIVAERTAPLDFNEMLAGGIFIFVTPMLPVVDILFIHETAGYEPGALNCFMTGSSRRADADLDVFYYPISGLLFVGFMCVVCVAVKLVVILYPRMVSQNSAAKISVAPKQCTSVSVTQNAAAQAIIRSFDLLRPIISFVSLVLILFTLFVILRLASKERSEQYDVSYRQWYECIFDNANMLDDAAVLETCGAHPDRRSITLGCVSIAGTSANCLLLVLIEMPAAIRYWYQRFIRGKVVSATGSGPHEHKSPQVMAGQSNSVGGSGLSSSLLFMEVSNFIPDEEDVANKVFVYEKGDHDVDVSKDPPRNLTVFNRPQLDMIPRPDKLSIIAESFDNSDIED